MKPDGSRRLFAVPLSLEDANALVDRWHRHNTPVAMHRFSIGVIDERGKIHGASIVSVPVARLAGHPRDVCEVVRLVTDGEPNACSYLYAASAKAAKIMGYRRIQTYILESEPGVSLRASGWVSEGVNRKNGKGWGNRPGRTEYAVLSGQKTRYALALCQRPDYYDEIEIPRPDNEISLFEGVLPTKERETA